VAKVAHQVKHSIDLEREAEEELLEERLDCGHA